MITLPGKRRATRNPWRHRDTMQRCKVCGHEFAKRFKVLWSPEPGICAFCGPKWYERRK